MRLLLIFFCTVLLKVGYGQVQQDSSSLEEVTIKAYFRTQPLLTSPASAGVVDFNTINRQAPGSLLPAINTLPGIRMEERSPGSYRLSIRGSLLRSPFGVRNVKVYLDDFILTDAGGNTYINILDAGNTGRIEILKGPEGSLFGANSGGVVLISSKQVDDDSLYLSAAASVGTFGLIHQEASLRVGKGDFNMPIMETFHKSKGYRDNSAMDRKSVIVNPGWSYSKSASIHALFMYAGLDYQTPGGLTLTQLQQNPRNARPGAADQGAAIYNNTVLAGLSHEQSFGGRLKHVLSVTGSSTDFKNPFITNYEVRKERSLGLRTYIENPGFGVDDNWNWQFGLESQQTNSVIQNYNNNGGERAEEQASDRLTARQSFLFARISAQFFKRLTVESAMSLNYYAYTFKGLYPAPTDKNTKSFNAQLMPRAALSYLFTKDMAWRVSASKGFSAPTISEVRPSGKVINADIRPEAGWNFESGFRISALKDHIYLDAVAFSFKLKNAIVRRVDAADAEFFINAGGTRQQGVEIQLSASAIPGSETGFIRKLTLKESYTGSNFRFDNYVGTATDYTGNRLTGVPEHNLVSAVDLQLPFGLGLYMQHSYISAIPLNDSNTEYAEQYHLLQAKVDLQVEINRHKINVFAGGDNLLDSDYSLGNDLNAFGSRFFNPAPSRNFYAGIKMSF